ncbi:hypothetical protein RJT34_27196 [Clitoria ternatea]|uniref:Uncharacterized protein n=1 Tax=Clitoria ternatea TaxID=43366 RepID=A0AAN9F7M7_CLITE
MMMTWSLLDRPFSLFYEMPFPSSASLSLSLFTVFRSEKLSLPFIHHHPLYSFSIQNPYLQTKKSLSF